MLTDRTAGRFGQWMRQVICACMLLPVIVLGGFSGVVQAGVKLKGFNMVQQENVMLHFDLDSANATADVFSLSNPDRLVIDLPQATLATPMPNETFSQGVVSRIRYAQHGADYLRVVLDLRRTVNASYEFIPRQGGQRLLIDLGVKGNVLHVRPVQKITEQAPLRDAVVAIDAGHGGRDGGAVGQKNTLEKDITLAVALNHGCEFLFGCHTVNIVCCDVGYDLSFQEGLDDTIQHNAAACRRTRLDQTCRTSVTSQT